MRRLLVPALAVAAAGFALLLWPARRAPLAGPAERLVLSPAGPKEAFARALAPKIFRIPEDQGPHYDYETEWWYVTGTLSSPDGQAFAYQLTIFRRGLAPGPPPAEGLATNQIYFAHCALTDPARGTHVYDERWSRGASGLAGASPSEAHVEDWRLEFPGDRGTWFTAAARFKDAGVDLRLEPRTRLVSEGEGGLSAKGREAGNASYYWSLPRLRTSGTIRTAGATHEVQGESWFDHEWSTSALAPGAVGWDWFGLQLDDLRELMFFRIRDASSSALFASGTLIDATGEGRRLGEDHARLKSLSWWRSPASGARYPSGWTLDLPEESLSLEVEPWIRDQELLLSFTYWEGAVNVKGLSKGRSVGGRGFVELTGYLHPMTGVF